MKRKPTPEEKLLRAIFGKDNVFQDKRRQGGRRQMVRHCDGCGGYHHDLDRVIRPSGWDGDSTVFQVHWVQKGAPCFVTYGARCGIVASEEVLRLSREGMALLATYIKQEDGSFALAKVLGYNHGSVVFMERERGHA